MAITALLLDAQSFYEYPSAYSGSTAYWLFHCMLACMIGLLMLTSRPFVTVSDKSRSCAKPGSTWLGPVSFRHLPLKCMFQTLIALQILPFWDLSERKCCSVSVAAVFISMENLTWKGSFGIKPWLDSSAAQHQHCCTLAQKCMWELPTPLTQSKKHQMRTTR